MIYQGQNGNSYNIDDASFAEGGEGALHNVLSDSSLVAKIYKPGKLQQSTAQKLLAMVANANPKVCESIAWPVDVIYNNTQLCGFIMHRFTGYTDLANILPAKDIDWQKRIAIAANLCDIVIQVHSTDQCIGDMNPKNFGVNLYNGHVVSFDADSFHFRADNRIFPCVVGVSDYEAPELHAQLSGNVDLRTLDPNQSFTQSTDQFSLAILIFQLLFAGFHPFTARRLENYGSSTTVHNRNTNILHSVTPFFNPSAGTGIPAGAPDIDLVPPDMQEMFRKAFLTSNRPSATQWQSSLLALLKNLKRCPNQHYYYTYKFNCPWCQLSERKIPTPPPTPAPVPTPPPAPQPEPPVIYQAPPSNTQTATKKPRRKVAVSEVVAFLSTIGTFYIGLNYKLAYDEDIVLALAELFILIICCRRIYLHNKKSEEAGLRPSLFSRFVYIFYFPLSCMSLYWFYILFEEGWEIATSEVNIFLLIIGILFSFLLYAEGLSD